MTNKQEEKLTDREKQILKVIIDYIDRNQISPTVREIGNFTQIKSTSTVQGHLEKLEKKGYIERNKTMPRTIRVLKGGEKMHNETVKDSMKEIEAIINEQVGEERINEIFEKGGVEIGELVCPHCNGKAMYKIYQHDFLGQKGLGTIAGCIENNCFQIMT